MGYSVARFLAAVDPNLMCCICCNVLEDAVLTPCGHSFCECCILSWLDTHGKNSCPECRRTMELDSVKPILALRRLIQSMEVACPNSARGCKVTIKLEEQDHHLASWCEFEPITCTTCRQEINRVDLPSHLAECQTVISPFHSFVCDDDDDGAENEILDLSRGYLRHVSTQSDLSLQSNLLSYGNGVSSQLARLLHRIVSLEKQVSRLLVDLQDAHARNVVLELRQETLSKQLDVKRRKVMELKNHDQPDSALEIDVDLSCSQQNMASLSQLIARHLLQKPKNINSDRVFRAVMRCYDTYSPTVSGDSDHDVHMLLATAYASNWFTAAQKVILGCWLQCLLRS